MQNFPNKLVFLGFSILSALTMGCAAKAPYLDQKFGETVNVAKAQQTINPDASQDTDAVKGIDGTAANAVVDRYYKSYEEKPKSPTIFNIGVGSATGAK